MANPTLRRNPVRSELHLPAPAGAFGEAHEAQQVREVREIQSTRDSRPSEVSWERVSWEREDSDVFMLKLPEGTLTGEVFPDIESAILAATEQVHRLPSSPELPAYADEHRRSRDSA